MCDARCFRQQALAGLQLPLLAVCCCLEPESGLTPLNCGTPGGISHAVHWCQARGLYHGCCYDSPASACAAAAVTCWLCVAVGKKSSTTELLQHRSRSNACGTSRQAERKLITGMCRP